MSRFVTVISTGMFTTIQDLGRAGYAHLGVPVSGAADLDAVILGNALLNNPKTAAVLECTMAGPQLRFHSDCHFVLTGASAAVELDGKAIVVGEIAFAKADQILSIQQIHSGIRTYLCVAGGFETEKVLGSRSYYAPLTPAHIEKGMTLLLGTPRYGIGKSARVKLIEPKKNRSTHILQIPVYQGPEYNLLDMGQCKRITEQIFTVSKQWNRMAIRLEEKMENTAKSIRTVPVIPGTVQLTPDGTLLVLSKDCQTTGGYPRILQISKRGMQQISQMGAGHQLQWVLI